MNVSGIRPIGGYISTPSIQHVGSTGAAAASENAGSSTSGQSTAAADEAKIAEAKARQTFKAPDFDALYRPESKGKIENTLRTADVEKAVSDMQKDEVLHQYQYFVGEAGANGANAGNGAGGEQQAQDAAVRGAENFTF